VIDVIAWSKLLTTLDTSAVENPNFLSQLGGAHQNIELYHASHLCYPPFYTSPMASSALQH